MVTHKLILEIEAPEETLAEDIEDFLKSAIHSECVLSNSVFVTGNDMVVLKSLKECIAS